MAVAYGKSGKEAGLDGQIIKATALEKLVAKKCRLENFMLHALLCGDTVRV